MNSKAGLIAFCCSCALTAMRLLLHNFLDCNIKTVKNGYPLKIEAAKVKEIEVDYDPDFLRHMFNRIDYKALREAAETLGAWR